MKKYLNNKFVKAGLYSSIGALLGYAYYYFVGCTNGCPLSSNWYITTGYGLLMGLTMAFPGKKKSDSQPEEGAHGS